MLFTSMIRSRHKIQPDNYELDYKMKTKLFKDVRLESEMFHCFSAANKNE